MTNRSIVARPACSKSLNLVAIEYIIAFGIICVRLTEKLFIENFPSLCPETTETRSTVERQFHFSVETVSHGRRLLEFPEIQQLRWMSGSGCNWAVEYLPRGQDVVGLNPPSKIEWLNDTSIALTFDNEERGHLAKVYKKVYAIVSLELLRL